MAKTKEPIGQEREVAVTDGRIRLGGILALIEGARGIVVFAHGSGSGRFSPRNNFVARVLQRAGLCTLLMDLLEEEEAEDRGYVFDIDLLARRLMLAKGWPARQPATRALQVGYFGASTGSGAALTAAALDPEGLFAVVSRGGRPDLAMDLHRVVTPTLLLVGGLDDVVIGLNREAFDALTCEKEMAIIPGATHLFEEPGTLELVAARAADWFTRHLARVVSVREAHAPVRGA
jgi:putative phosphoribosyl transferase